LDTGRAVGGYVTAGGASLQLSRNVGKGSTAFFEFGLLFVRIKPAFGIHSYWVSGIKEAEKRKYRSTEMWQLHRRGLHIPLTIHWQDRKTVES